MSFTLALQKLWENKVLWSSFFYFETSYKKEIENASHLQSEALFFPKDL